MVSILASGPSYPGFNSQHSKIIFEEKIIDALVEESGQWVENVDQTHQVLASGKPLLYKKMKSNFFLFFYLRFRYILVKILNLNLLLHKILNIKPHKQNLTKECYNLRSTANIKNYWVQIPAIIPLTM